MGKDAIEVLSARRQQAAIELNLPRSGADNTACALRLGGAPQEEAYRPQCRNCLPGIGSDVFDGNDPGWMRFKTGAGHWGRSNPRRLR